jgi:hypothetical protein
MNNLMFGKQLDTRQMPVAEAAKIFSESGMFPDAKSAAAVATQLLVGRSLGMNDYEAMSSFHIIQGKANLCATAMAAAIKSHPDYNYKVLKKTNEECEVEFFEKIDGKWSSQGTQVFDMNDAKRAGLGGTNWKKYPRAMLFARCISEGYRTFCPNAFGMAPVYVEEHGESEVPQPGEIQDAEVIEESPVRYEDEDDCDKVKQLCADWEERTGKNCSRDMCGYFGVESIDDLNSDQLAYALESMKTKLKGLDNE